MIFIKKNLIAKYNIRIEINITHWFDSFKILKLNAVINTMLVRINTIITNNNVKILIEAESDVCLSEPSLS